MVDPIPNDERVRTLRAAKVATVLLIAASAGLITVYGGAPLRGIALACAAGLLVGVALVWYLFPSADAIAPASRRRR